MGKWYDYLKGLDQDKEEEEKEEDRDDALSFWTDFQRFKRTGELRDSSAKNTPEEERERTAADQDNRLLSERLADRGVKIELPEPEKKTVKTDSRPTLAEAAAQGKSSSLFMDRIGNTYTAERNRLEEQAKAEEEKRKDETVRNPEWLSSLRSPEEIQADLDAVNAEAADYDKQAFKNNALGVWREAFGQGRVTAANNRRISRERAESDRRKAELENELAERTWADYERKRSNPDFEEKSKYVSRKNKDWKGTEYNPLGGYDSVKYEDPLYEYVNGNEDAGKILAMEKEENARAQGILGFLVPEDTYNYEQAAEMTDDERALYNYIHATEGSQAAYEYFDYLRSDLYRRQMEREKDIAYQAAREHPVESTVATIGLSPLRGAAYLGQAAQYLTEGSVDENAPYNRIAALSSTERQAVTRLVENKWGRAGTFAYGVGVSTAEFLLNSALTGGGASGVSEAFSLALMGSGAAADATIEAKERGLSDGQSYALGTMAGLAEIVTEKVSVENLFRSDLKGLRYLLKNTFSEGSEEVGSDLINWFADILVARDRSEWQASIDQYKKEGLNEREAFLAALKDKGMEMLLDGASGALSGFLMAMGPAAADIAQQSQDRSRDIEALRSAYKEKPDLMKGIRQAQTMVVPTTREEAAQAQGEPEGGIVLPTAEEAAGAAEASDGGPETQIQIGAEPQNRNRLKTADEAELDEQVKGARNITEATGIRYGVDKKTIRRAERQGRASGYTVEFYRDEGGKNGTVTNGFFDPKKNRIYYNAAAKQTFGFTFGHEFTHPLEGTEAYDYLSDRVMSRITESGGDTGAMIDRVMGLYKRAGLDLTRENAKQEVVADWVGENYSDERTIREICRENPSVGKRIRDALDSFVTRAAEMGGIVSNYEVEKIRNTIRAYDRYLGNFIRRTQETVRRVTEEAAAEPTRAETEAPVQAVQTAPVGEEAVQAQGEESVEDYRARMASLLDAGEIDEEQYDAAMDLADEAEAVGGFSSSTVERDEGPRGKLAEIADRVRGRYSVSPEEDRAVRKAVREGKAVNTRDEVQYSLSLDADYQANAEKKNAQAGNVDEDVLRQAGKSRSIVKAKLESVKDAANLPPDIPGNTAQGNSSYGTSEENTTVCPRSMAIDSLSDAVAEQLGRPLTVEESVYIAQEAFNYTDMPQCLYCYVAMDRMAKREYMGEYLNKRNSVIENLQSGMSVDEARDVYRQSETNNGKDEKNWTGARQTRFNQWVKEFQTGARMIQMSDLASDAAVERAMKDPQLAPQVRDAMKYAQSASWAKKRVGYTAYNGHILKWTQDRINKLNSMFGLRMYSFSDYSTAFVLENMQMVTDAAVRGLKMLAYTKDLDFVRAFAPTDMNINISTFGMDGADGTVHQDAMQGADWTEAQALRAEHPNVGITFVATNDSQVEWALDQDWIDVVIPFHMVKTGAKVANIFGYQNYTGESSDRTEEGKKGEIYPNEHQNSREKYFAALEEQGLEPRFKRWAEHPNYMKLVNETRRSAGDTPAVKPIFNTDAALESIDGMVARGGYNQPIGGSLDVQAELAEEMADKIARGMAENLRIRNGIIVDENGNRRYSVSEEEDEAYMKAVEDGDTETAQRMVDEAAERAGYTIKAWHGSRNKFNAFSRGKLGSNTGTQASKQWFFAADYDTANSYYPLGVMTELAKQHPKMFGQKDIDDMKRRGIEGKLYPLYIKMTNPLEVDVAGYDYAAHTQNKDAMMEYIRQAEEEGRDGIILYHVRDNNLKPEEESSTDYMFRDPEQAKSADPVTYDDEGNVIPLSERFNAENDDIRWSVSEAEEEQTESEAFKNWFGDWQADPENASKVVDENGRPKRMYHGTNASRDFNFFDTYGSNYGLYGTGSYFTENPEVASSYALNKGRGSSPRIYPVYLNIRNPIDMNAQADIDRWLNALPELADYVVDDTGNLTAETNHDWYRAMEEYMRDEMMRKWEAAEFAQDLLTGMGYDGIRHIGGLNRGEGMQHDVWIAFDPTQIKSAIGNRGTFDPENGDIRRSVSEADEERGPIYALPMQARNAALRAENALATSMAQAFGLETRRTTEAYRQFRTEAARPIVEAMIENRDIDPDEIFARYWSGSLTEGQEARDAFDTALTDAWRKIQRVNRFAGEQRAAEEAQARRNAEIDAQIPDTADDIIKLGERYKAAKRERNRVLGRLLLSDEDLELARDVAAGDMADEEVYARRPWDYQDILEAAAAEREFREADALWGRYTRRIAERRFEQADRDLAGAEDWKDKGSGFAYARETAERNIRDVAGSSAAALIDDYIRPIHKAEAESTRMKNEYIKRVADLKLDRKVRRGNAVSEAAAVQWLGEAMDNIRYLETMHRPDAWRDGMTLDEWRSAVEQFRAENPNLDYGKIERGIEEFKKIYDELITRMNQVLVENGYLPVNVRRGYFPHFNGGDDGILQKFAGLLGINIDSQALPTAINGLTNTFKPGKAWFGHAQERTGFRTDYDAVQGFDGYIGGVSDVINQTANIRNLRALATRIRYQFGDEGIKKRIDEINADDSRSETEKLAAIHDLTENGRYKLSRFVAWLDEYTNLLANKKSRYDRGIEDLMGRKFYTWMKNIEGRVASNMISANLGSALTNFIPLNQAGAMLGDLSMLRGAWDTVIGRGRHDGFVRRSDFLTNRRGTDPLIQNRADRISEFLSSPMNLIDNFVSETIVRAAYVKNLRQGMDQQTAMDMADEFAAGVMADRSKGAQPTIFGSRNPLMKLFTQFQVEVNNEFSTIFKDIPKGTYRNDKDKKQAVAVAAWTLLRYFIGAYLFNDLYEKIVGRRAALDPLDLLNDAVGDFSGRKLNNVFDMISEGVIDEGERANPSDAILSLAGNTAEELPFVGGLLGGGRIPISSALPDVETIVKGIANEDWSREKKAQTVGRELGSSIVTYILPPFAGGAIKKAVQTAETAAAGGRYVKDAQGRDQIQYPFYNDTPGEAARSLLSSALFGPTSTEPGREWVEGGFGSQSAKNTEIYRRLTDEYGESQRASWDFVRSLRGQDAQGKREAVAASGLSEEGKAAAMAEVVSDSERAKFRASGVSADAWAGFFAALPDFDEDGNGSYKQAEVTAALDNVRIPLSSGEGAAQGLFGGDTETRSLTREEKAAIWSAYNPKWKTDNNPFDAAVGERVVSRIGQGGE